MKRHPNGDDGSEYLLRRRTMLGPVRIEKRPEFIKQARGCIEQGLSGVSYTGAR